MGAIVEREEKQQHLGAHYFRSDSMLAFFELLEQTTFTRAASMGASSVRRLSPQRITASSFLTKISFLINEDESTTLSHALDLLRA